jgi:hypothetical protein
MAAVLTLTLPGATLAAEPADLVSPSELHQRLVDKEQVRQERVARLRGLLSSPQAQKALAASQMDAGKIVDAVALLGDAELARLSERAAKAEADFAAGALTNQQLTYIVIALATAVIIIVIVVA